MKVMHRLYVAVGVAALAAVCGPIHAVVLIQSSNNLPGNEENVPHNSGATGTTVTGTTQNSKLEVFLSSTDSDRTVQRSGASRP